MHSSVLVYLKLKYTFLFMDLNIFLIYIFWKPFKSAQCVRHPCDGWLPYFGVFGSISLVWKQRVGTSWCHWDVYGRTCKCFLSFMHSCLCESSECVENSWCDRCYTFKYISCTPRQSCHNTFFLWKVIAIQGAQWWQYINRYWYVTWSCNLFIFVLILTWLHIVEIYVSWKRLLSNDNLAQFVYRFYIKLYCSLLPISVRSTTLI